jgi:hypothetical protein
MYDKRARLRRGDYDDLKLNASAVRSSASSGDA